MAAPVPPVKKHDYSDYSGSNPTAPHRGDWLDEEFAELRRAATDTIDELQKIQKDDGTLENQTVGLEQLKPGLYDQILAEVTPDIDADIQAAEAASDAALAAATVAESHKTAAETAATQANSSAGQVQAQVNLAQTYRNEAQTFASQALASENNVSNHANDADLAAAEAFLSAELAEAWATKTDAPIEFGLYGARYYAIQAANIVGTITMTFTGSGAPSGGTGNDGDMYYDATNKAWYGPKVGGVWGAPTPIVGPAGPVGINWSGTWSVTTGYVANQAVELDGASYICLAAHTAASVNRPGTGASWTSFWNLIAARGSPGAAGSGSGNVIGPVGAANNSVVTFNGTSGTSIKDSGILISDLALASHNHTGVYQPLDADLNAVAALATTGVVERTAPGTFGTFTVTAFAKSLLDDVDATAGRATLGLAIGTNVQAYSAELAALAGLSTTGFIERTGAGTYTVNSATTTGRNLLTAANAAAGRSTLGLVIGTDVQAYDADLQALAGIATTGLLERTGAGTAQTVPITSFGKSLLDDADATAGRATLGLGALAIKNTIQTADLDPNQVTLAKLQTIAAARLLGSIAGGNISELTLSQLLDFIGSADEGDLLYRQAGGWARLPRGTNGQVLTLQANVPSWQTLATEQTMIPLGKVVVGGTQATVELAFTASTFAEIICVGENVSHNSASSRELYFALSANGGSSWSAAAIIENQAHPQTVTSTVHARVSGLMTTAPKHVMGWQSWPGMSNPSYGTALPIASMAPPNRLKFFWSGGSFDSGTFNFYGVKANP